MSLAGIEPAIPEIQLFQTYALDRAATGIVFSYFTSQHNFYCVDYTL